MDIKQVMERQLWWLVHPDDQQRHELLAWPHSKSLANALMKWPKPFTGIGIATGATTFSLISLNIMTLSINTLSIMGLFFILSINNTQVIITICNEFHFAECLFHLLFCWMSLSWVSLCWMSWRPVFQVRTDVEEN